MDAYEKKTNASEYDFVYMSRETQKHMNIEIDRYDYASTFAHNQGCVHKKRAVDKYDDGNVGAYTIHRKTDGWGSKFT